MLRAWTGPANADYCSLSHDWGSCQLQSRYVMLGNDNIVALFLSHSLAEPQSTGKLLSLGPWPRNTWGISRPNNGCLCFLHLLLRTAIHLHPFLTFYVIIPFRAVPTLPLLKSPTLSVAKYRGIEPSDIRSRERLFKYYQLWADWTSRLFLVSVPEDTHEESVRHNGCKSSLFQKGKKKKKEKEKVGSESRLCGRQSRARRERGSRLRGSAEVRWQQHLFSEAQTQMWPTRGGRYNRIIQKTVNFTTT